MSYLWERYVFRKNPYYSHIWEWYRLWKWYGVIAMVRNDMGMVWELQSLPYQTHIYGKDKYFMKIHTIPIHGNNMGYGNGIGWLSCEGMIWEWYGSLNQSHTKPGEVTAPNKSHINQYLLHKLWKNYGTTMGKTTCTHSKPIPQLLTGGMQLLVKNISTKVKIIQEYDHFVIKL